MKCPVCGCRRFHLPDPEDPYEIYEFEVDGEQARFRCEQEGIPAPALDEEARCSCDQCSWSGPVREIRKA
ncbi:MAG: hypothetical protein ACLFOY_02000 [Desulfatibacillaceae bacterium]